MEPKPKGWWSEYGRWFQEPSVAERYDLRPAPPVEAFEEHTTQPEPWTPTLDELIGCHHSQNGFVLEKLAQAAAFDGEVAR